MAQLTNTVLNGKLVVNGNIYGNLIGNASTATSAANAISLNGKAESALHVYSAITASSATNATLANSATSIATTAAVATSTYVLLGALSDTAAQTPVRTGIEIIGTNINACTYTLNVGTIKGNYEVEGAVEQATYAVSAGYAGYALKLNNGSSDLSVGSSIRPVYFSGGVPVQTSTTLAISITGNASTATTADNATSLNGKAESALSVSHASTASTATYATSAGYTTKVAAAASTGKNYIIGATEIGSVQPIHANSSIYVTGGNTVVAPTFSGALSGNASSADCTSKVEPTAIESGSYHLAMVETGTADNRSLMLISSSKALTYNVSTGVVSATTFSGSLSGTATKAGGLSASAGSSSVPVYFNASGKATSVTSISKGLIPTDFFPQKVQTQCQSNTNFYGASYPIYAKWVTSNIAKWLVTGYHTAAEYSQALINSSYTTISVGSTTLPVYFSGGVPVQTSTTLAVSITGNAATATQATSANYATSLKVQDYTTSPGYLLAAVTATGDSLPIYSNTNIKYYPSISTLQTPTISTNTIIHSDATGDLLIGNSSNDNYVRIVEDTVFDNDVEIDGALSVKTKPVVTDVSSFGHKIKVLTSTEFAALSAKSTDTIYFITP